MTALSSLLRKVAKLNDFQMLSKPFLMMLLCKYFRNPNVHFRPLSTLRSAQRTGHPMSY
jgi:hypothetical protein